jgi:hypothetical protein
LVLKIKAPLGAGVWDFVFFAVPSERVKELDSLTSQVRGCSSDFTGKSSTGYKHDEFVLTGITQLIEGVEKVVPSLVTLEASKQRLDFRRRILTSTPHAVIEIGGSFPKREDSEVRELLSSGDKSRVIKTCPEMFDDFGGEHAPLSREPLCKVNFVDGMNAVRIKLNQTGVWLFSEKLINLGFEVIEMFVCSREP